MTIFSFFFLIASPMRQNLKKTAVPSVFFWSPEPKPTAQARAAQAAHAAERSRRWTLIPPVSEGVSDIGIMDVVEEVVTAEPRDNDIDILPAPIITQGPQVSCLIQTDPESKTLIAIEKICQSVF